LINASRPNNVTDGTFSADYSYVANSPLIGQITFKQGSTLRMTTTKSYDYANRLMSISSQPAASGASAISYNYAHNDSNQRLRVALADGSYWISTCDSLGQVTSGKRYIWHEVIMRVFCKHGQPKHEFVFTG
jgi:hypothetical protein